MIGPLLHHFLASENEDCSVDALKGWRSEFLHPTYPKPMILQWLCMSHSQLTSSAKIIRFRWLRHSPTSPAYMRGAPHSVIDSLILGPRRFHTYQPNHSHMTFTASSHFVNSDSTLDKFLSSNPLFCANPTSSRP